MADVSALYPQPPQQQNSGILAQNPLQILGALNQVNQLRQFNAQFGANQAIGQAYQGAMNPDGTVDMTKLAAGLHNPAAAYGLPQAAAGMAGLQGQNISNATAQLGLGQKQTQFVSDFLSSVDPKTATSGTVNNMLTVLARNTNIPSGVLQQFKGMILSDPQGIPHALQNLKNVGIGAAGTSGRVAGPPGPEGQPTSISVGEANYMGGGTPVATPGKPNTQPAVGIATGLPPGVAEARNVTGAGSGQALATARNQGISYQNQVFPLEQAIPALESLGTKGTGPGTDTLNQLKSFVLSNVPGADFSGIKDSVAEYDKAKKYLTDFVNQNGNTATNDKLAAAFAGNPSVHISNAAATDVAKAALSLRRMKQAQLTSFEQSGQGDENYAKYASQWNLQHDPRVYGFDMMSPAQRTSVLKSLPQSKRELFMLDVQDALKNGIIHPPKR